VCRAGCRLLLARKRRARAGRARVLCHGNTTSVGFRGVSTEGGSKVCAPVSTSPVLGPCRRDRRFEINAGCKCRTEVPGLRPSGRAALVSRPTGVGPFHATSYPSGLYGSVET
jgi:hypothetical protein